MKPCQFYVASRANIPERSAMWRSLRSNGAFIVSTWIDDVVKDSEPDLGELWERIESEIKISDKLVLYVDPSDFPLRGAFVEVGMALGMGKHVIIVAPGMEVILDGCKALGSWIKHPRVSFEPNLKRVFELS